jgi:site-specific DNA-methyltransferase (adenine-specific)
MIRLHEGDCLDVLRDMPADSIDAVVTDPPYHLTSIVKRFGARGAAPAKTPEGGTGAFARASRGFMGQTWDGGDIAFRPETWAEVARVMKPGAHLVAFGGSRSWHRLAVAIEDAGFEVRDSLAWLYGTGFPKSHDVARDLARLDEDGAPWQGWGTALKPGFEPIVLARKPLAKKSVARQVLATGTGAINIDGCRIPGVKPQVTQGINSRQTSYSVTRERRVSGDPNEVRFPANVLHDGSDEALAVFPHSKDGVAVQRNGGGQKIGGNGICGGSKGLARPDAGYGGGGSAARFFYCAKASKADRRGSKHPTVKPQTLMRWLVTLVTPPGGVILDPFAGSGSTGWAAHVKGFDAVLIEREAAFAADIRRLIDDLSNGEAA